VVVLCQEQKTGDDVVARRRDDPFFFCLGSGDFVKEQGPSCREGLFNTCMLILAMQLRKQLEQVRSMVSRVVEGSLYLQVKSVNCVFGKNEQSIGRPMDLLF